MEIYYIEEVMGDWRTKILGYFTSLDKAKEALKNYDDLWIDEGTGIYKVKTDVLEPVSELVYQA